jgi:hypothetical protein
MSSDSSGNVATLRYVFVPTMPLCGVVMNKHELSKTDFDLIEKGLNALLNSAGPDPALAEKIKDLRGMFMDAYTGWLEIEDEAA